MAVVVQPAVVPVDVIDGRNGMAAGIPETRFHDLRHTYATNAIRIGDPIKTVSENLGHATVAFTLDEYGHVTPAMKQDSADRMQRLIDSCS